MRSRYETAILFAALVAAHTASAGAAEGWRHGIGTGLFGLNIDGDTGFGTRLFGPVEAELDLSSSDLADYLDSAFGLAGFSTNGTWTINYGAERLKLEDDGRGTTRTGAPVAGSFGFEAIGAEISAAYRFAGSERSAWSLLGGVSYTRHDYDIGLVVGQAGTTRSIDNDWTDVLVGLVYSLGFSERTAWVTQLDAGFGGSEGTYHAKTALNWHVGASRSWLLSLYVDYKAVEFENGSPGDPDWYLYDVDEFGPGFGIAYVF